MTTAKEKGIHLYEPCIKCGGQPAVHKGKTYWTAHCPMPHIPGGIRSTPMLTKRAALDAWNADMKREQSYAAK